MGASISDVAARAGVSVATVSRALRGLPNVAEPTRGRVLSAARELDYVANPNASRLAAGRTMTVGMVVPLLSRWFFTQVVAGAQSVLAAAGYDVLLYDVGGAGARDRFFRRLPFRKRVDGIVIVDLPLTACEQDVLETDGTPVVTVGLTGSRFSNVGIDNVAAARTATRHLLNLRHTSVALLSGQPVGSVRFSAPLQRRRGWQQALAERGIAARDDLEVDGGFSISGGAQAMAQLLALGDPPTAVFSGSDEMALGALKTLADSGVRVPADCSVIGFDDHDVAGFFGLTTMHQPVAQLGEVAASLLFDAIRGGGGGPRPDVVLPTTLRMRSTTGPAPVPAATAGRRAAAIS